MIKWVSIPDGGENRKYVHEDGSKFIRCVDVDTGELLFVITAGRVENADNVMQDLDYGS